MIKPTKFISFHLTIFHIYHFVIGNLQTHLKPNNQNKSRTKLSNKSKNIFGRKIQNSPITSTFGPIKTLLILHRTSKVCKFPGLICSHSF